MEHGNPKLVCPETDCTKEFGSAPGLRGHNRAEHQGGFKCSRPGCDYMGAEERDLSNHDRAKHGAPKLECPEAKEKYFIKRGFYFEKLYHFC